MRPCQGREVSCTAGLILKLELGRDRSRRQPDIRCISEQLADCDRILCIRRESLSKQQCREGERSDWIAETHQLDYASSNPAGFVSSNPGKTCRRS